MGRECNKKGDGMMEGHGATPALLTAILVATLSRTFLVFDAVRGRSGLVASVARRISATAYRPSSPRPQHRTGGLIRFWLVSMHLLAALAQVASVAKYTAPVSDTSCRTTARAMVALVLLYDASLVAFFLTKVAVTNGDRPLSCLETGIIWGSRAYAWVLLPLGAIFMSFKYPGYANDEENYCFSNYGLNGDAYGWTYVANNFFLVVEFVSLLGLFVKPMLVRQEHSQSGRAFYRRVVLRNVVCTASISAVYILATMVVAVAFINRNPDTNTTAVITDITRSIKRLLALCMTEISLPLGFSSCWEELSAAFKSRNREIRQARATIVLSKPGINNVAGTASAAKKVVPLQDNTSYTEG